ncbi:MAG: arsenosugar biosynthesis radical SAM protein ArsS [Deltaproteobacteria bacterium]|nr:arsenosugar biosynthesis radical SAM protein ArsS [Deltaproteobacteria bacterium]
MRLLKPFDEALKEAGLFPLVSGAINVFQINMGYLCNLSCSHCHLSAGPKRKEVMTRETMSAILRVIPDNGVVDITGGAPEINPHFRWFIEALWHKGCRIKARTNLAALLNDGLPCFFADKKVELIGSFPFYLESTFERQRGKGSFIASIEALRRLNGAGYGIEESGLSLHLVYNPLGAFLPPAQKSIEADFRRELKKRFDVSFTSLFTITNMPIGRFKDALIKNNALISYMEKLEGSFNPEVARNVMCRETLSFAWDGSLYDCDFNQALGIKCTSAASSHIKDFDLSGWITLGMLEKRRIATGLHCYGCTAGSGSSCTGALSS